MKMPLGGYQIQTQRPSEVKAEGKMQELSICKLGLSQFGRKYGNFTKR